MRKVKKLAAVLLSAALMITSLQLPGVRKEATAATFKNRNAEEITEAMGAGWNLGNQLEAVNSWSGSVAFPDETSWGNPKVTKELIAAVRRAGFKSVRIPVSYLSKIGSKEEGYKIDSAWLNRLEEIVGYVTANGMYAIINMHGDGYSTVSGGWLLPGKGDSAQTEIKEKYRACWEQIATKFKNQSEKVIFESMNEVGADADKDDAEEVAAYYKNINAYNQIFVDTVRQSGGNNDKRWLLIPGLDTNVDKTVGDDGFQIPEDKYLSDTVPEGEKRIMISVHYYSPTDFCLDENYTVTQWGVDVRDPVKAATGGLEDGMESQFVKLKNRFVDEGYPVVIGEYGSVDKSQVKPEDITSGKFDIEDVDRYNNEYRVYYTQVLNVLAKRYGCIPVYWDNGYNGAFGFGIFNRSTYVVTQPEIVKAIMKTYKSSANTVTKISLDQTSLKMCLGDDSVQLTASLEPESSTENVTWSSSNPEVAAVSQSGKVAAQAVGNAVITANAGGKQAYCVVHVSPAERFKARLYYNSVTGGWNYATISSTDYVTVEAGQSGTYTLKLNGAKDRMTHINTLYLKDILGDTGQAENSIIGKATVTIDSLKMNDTEFTMTKNPFYYDASELDSDGNPRSIFDICLINVWDETYVSEFSYNPNSAGSFPAEAYVDGTNTLTLTFTLTDIELSEKRIIEVEPDDITLSQDSLEIMEGQEESLTAQLSPENTTYNAAWLSDNPAVATVSSDGKVTGVSAGTTTIHAFSGNGLEKTCTVSVSKRLVDMEKLKSLIADAEGVTKSDYTERSYSKLEEALQEAKDLMGTSSTDSAEVERVQELLENTLSRLVKADTFQKLESLVEEAAGLKKEDYTEDSWNTLETALNAAQEACESDESGETQMQAILTELQAAVSGLKKVEGSVSDPTPSPQNPGQTETPQNPGQTETPQNPGQTETPQNPGQTTAPQDPGQTAAPQDSGQTTASSAFQNKKVTLSKVKSPKKKTVQMTWKKLAGAKGYELSLATDKKFTKAVKKVTIKKAATTKATVNKLKAGKKYYVRVRAWKTVSGKKQYSKWSAVKSVTVKK